MLLLLHRIVWYKPGTWADYEKNLIRISHFFVLRVHSTTNTCFYFILIFQKKIMMLACGAVVGGILLWWLGSYMGFWGS